MKNDISNYLRLLIVSISKENSKETRTLLNKVLDCNLDHDYINDNVTKIVNSYSQLNNANEKWIIFISNLITFNISKDINKEIAFEYLKSSYLAIYDIYNQFNEQSFIGSVVLKFFFNNLVLLAEEEDKRLENERKKMICLDNVGKLLMDFFSRFQNSDDKVTIFYCDLNLIKTYFKLKTYRNSKTFFGWVERSSINLKTVDSQSEVNYYYYYGRITLYEMNIEVSRKYFEKAFKLMKKNGNDWQMRNKSIILEYLITLNLFYGLIVPKTLLIKYDLEHYYELLCSFASGDINSFEEEINILEERLVNLGTFLLIEKLKCYVLRNFIFKIFDNMKEEIEKMKFPVLKICFLYDIYVGYSNEHRLYEDIEEFEYNVLSVIYKGLINGYVHNTKKEIVFSKKNPFPIFSEVILNNISKIN